MRHLKTVTVCMDLKLMQKQTLLEELEKKSFPKTMGPLKS